MMNKQIIRVLLLASLVSSTTIPATKSNSSWSSKFTSFVAFPEEVYLDTPLSPDEMGLIQLDEHRIHELRERIKYNFMRRNQLSYGSSALAAGVFAIGLYQFGVFNLLMPAPKIEPANPENIASRLKFLEETVKRLVEKENIQQRVSRFDWLLNSAKSLTSFFTLAVASTKMMQIKNYIEAKPTIAYFLSRYNLLERVEVLRKTVASAVQPLDDEIHSLDYHRRAILPMLQSIAIHLEKFVAYTDYYFESQDKELVQKQKMEDQSRRLYNLSNSFLRKMHEKLSMTRLPADILATVEEFKSDLALSIKRCTFFEKEFVEQD